MNDNNDDDKPLNLADEYVMPKEPPVMTRYGKIMREKAKNLIKLIESRKQILTLMDMNAEGEKKSEYPSGQPTACLIKIVSGGQTGVDRAALDAAMNLGFPAGGWCPEGRLAEDGRIPDGYPLEELPCGGYSRRTRQNVRDSDATLIIYYDQIKGGTKLTLSYCLKEKKPFLLIDAQIVHVPDAMDKVLRFVDDQRVGRLNVAGPRGSSGEWAYSYTRELMNMVLERVICGLTPSGIRQRCKSELVVFLEEECGYRDWFWFPRMTLTELETWWTNHENISEFSVGLDSPYKLPGTIHLVESSEEYNFWIDNLRDPMYCKAWINSEDDSYLVTIDKRLLVDKAFPAECLEGARRRLSRYLN